MILTHSEALLIGATQYFSERPCYRGHLTNRYVSGGCIVCTHVRANAWHASNPDKRKKKCRDWRVNHPDRAKAKDERRYNGPVAQRRRAAAKAAGS